MSAMANARSTQHFPVANNVTPLVAAGDTASSITFDCGSDSPVTSAMMLARERRKAGNRRDNCVMRKSCDLCSIRKRRCDGSGTRACSLCRKKGSACVYSKNRKYVNYWPSARKAHGDLGLRPHEESLKRCRLSASPATGLVGMEENILLSTYFECMDFLPITSQSDIREAMVRIMTTRFATRRTSYSTGEIIRHSIEPNFSLCSFWFSIAMGGLLQGRPKEAVETYTLRANAAVNAFDEVPSSDLARIWLQMAVLSAFSGNLDGFRVNVDRAQSVVRDLKLQGSPDELHPGFLEMVEHSKVLQLLFAQRNSRDDLQSFINHDIGPVLKVGNIVTLEEISQFSMQTFRHHGQAFLVDVLTSLNERDIKTGNAQTLERQYLDGQLSQHSEEWTNLTTNAAVAEEYGVEEETAQLMRTFTHTYERLEDIVARPSIRSGASLVINLPLCITKIAQRDVNGALAPASRATEVFLSYPGLMRFEFGMHMCHLFLTLLSIVEFTELFEKLRVGYNNHRLRGPAIPPMEEWEGLGRYCNNAFCRTVEKAFKKLLGQDIGPKLTGNERKSDVETAFLNREGETARRTNRWGLLRGSDHPKPNTDKGLEGDSLLEIEGDVVSEERGGGLDAFVVGYSGVDPNAAAGPMVSLGGQVNPVEQVGVDVLHPEDWKIAIDAILEEFTPDLE